MTAEVETERPLPLYVVTLYFVLSGFLEAIQKYREWEGPLSLSPFAQQSVWQLLVHVLIYLAVAYLIWHRTWLGRLAALVYGYLMLLTYFLVGIAYLLRSTELNITPLFLLIGLFHVVALIPVVAYLQRARQKRRFHVSLLELMFSND